MCPLSVTKAKKNFESQDLLKDHTKNHNENDEQDLNVEQDPVNIPDLDVVVNQNVEQREEENLQDLNDCQSYANNPVEISEDNVDINESDNNDLDEEIENLQDLNEQHESQSYTNDPLQISEGNGDTPLS